MQLVAKDARGDGDTGCDSAHPTLADVGDLDVLLIPGSGSGVRDAWKNPMVASSQIASPR